MAVPVGDYKQEPEILQHCAEATIMETLLEANQASEHILDNGIEKLSATAGVRLFQSIVSTLSKLQLHLMPVFGKSPERETPPMIQNLPERERSSWNH